MLHKCTKCCHRIQKCAFQTVTASRSSAETKKRNFCKIILKQLKLDYAQLDAKLSISKCKMKCCIKTTAKELRNNENCLTISTTKKVGAFKKQLHTAYQHLYNTISVHFTKQGLINSCLVHLPSTSDVSLQ